MLKMHEQIPWSRGREVSGGQRAEHPLAAMHREMDRLLDEFWRGFDLPAWNRGERPGMISPRIEVRDTDEAIIVTAELPGLEEKDVEVTLSDTALLIRGEKKTEVQEKEGAYSYCERSFGSFERRIPIDIDVAGERVTASMSNGLLTVMLPKTPEAKSKMRRIEIGGGPGGIGGEKQAD
jgi:HSP20 family protein